MIPHHLISLLSPILPSTTNPGHNTLVPALATGTAAILAYLALVRALRWRKYHEIHAKYHSRLTVDAEGRKTWNITPNEAQKIMMVSSGYDMPKLLNLALSFALFKTYAIPSISKLLYATKELGSSERIAKRYADTEILISTFVGCPLSGFHDLSVQPDGKSPAQDSRGPLALARMNFLHSKYNISNDDYLFTMALFVIEPVVWAKRYGWRAVSDLEAHAYFVFWCEVAKRMGIINVPETLDGLISWSQAYADAKMVPAKTNHLVAKHTTAELVGAVPAAFGLRAFVERLTICTLDDQVRIAMMQPAQPWWMHTIVDATLHSVALAHRFLCLPRTTPCFAVDVLPPTDSASPLRPRVYRGRPWYKPESTGLGFLRDRILVALGYYAEMPSSKFRSGGYVLEEMGPLVYEKEGNEETRRAAEKFQGCPIAKLY